jgi:hypothetical protein
MRRTLTVLSVVALMVAILAVPAFAAANPKASCVGTLHSNQPEIIIARLVGRGRTEILPGSSLMWERRARELLLATLALTAHSVSI